MKGRLAAVVLGVLIVAGGVSCTTIRTRVWMNEGNKLYKAQKYDEAVKFYEKIVAIDPNNWTANYLIAMSYTALYHPGSEHEKDKEYVESATKSFEKLMTMQAPDKDTEERVRNYYVALLLAASKTDKVKTYYEGLLAKDPRNTKLLGQIADIYAKGGDFENSLKYYQKRAEIEPNIKEDWYTIGVLCWDRVHNLRSTMSEEENLKTIDIGVAALEKAINLDKQYFEGLVYINLIYREKALVLSSASKAVEAGEAFDKAEEYRKIAEGIGKKRMAEQAAAKKGA
jgi:tetratricopeptide (TPR) repeat protein